MSIAPFLGFASYGFDFARTLPLWEWMLFKVSFMRAGVIALILTVFGLNRPILDCKNDEFSYCHFKNPKVGADCFFWTTWLSTWTVSSNKFRHFLESFSQIWGGIKLRSKSMALCLEVITSMLWNNNKTFNSKLVSVFYTWDG